MLHPIPFPLASGRYEVGPGMRKFGQPGQGMEAEQGHFRPDAGLAPTLAAKLAVLKRAPHECHLAAAQAGEDGLRAALEESFRLLAAEHPEMVAVQESGVTLRHLGLRLAGWERVVQSGAPWPELAGVAGAIARWLAGRKGLPLLGDALALSVQEDLALVRGPAREGEGDVLEWLHVCLPSGWSPSEKVGLSFLAVHEPVANSGPLLAAGERIVRAMIGAGPFVRHVWGIHRDGELCHNPRLHRSPPWRAGAPADLARQAFFRVERQTTCGFPALNRALFTIRYWVEPLASVAGDPWRRERLASALVGMDAAELAYKGLAEARDGLVAWLQQEVAPLRTDSNHLS